jgi:hypothetical protein
MSTTSKMVISLPTEEKCNVCSHNIHFLTVRKACNDVSTAGIAACGFSQPNMLPIAGEAKMYAPVQLT